MRLRGLAGVMCLGAPARRPVSGLHICRGFPGARISLDPELAHATVKRQVAVHLGFVGTPFRGKWHSAQLAPYVRSAASAVHACHAGATSRSRL